MFLGVWRSYTLGDCTAAADGFPGFICPPEQTYDLAAGSLVQRPAEDQPHTRSGHTHLLEEATERELADAAYLGQ